MGNSFWLHTIGYLSRSKSRPVLLISLIILLTVPLGCRGKHAIVVAPQPDAEVSKYLAEGDASFREAHLFGWRQAEVSYRKAYDLTASDEVKEKLLLTRFLILIRQIDEDIPNPKAEETVKELCAGNEIQKNLCAIAQWYEKGKNRSRPDIKTNSIFNGEHPELEAYFNYLISNSGPEDNAAPGLETLTSQFDDSPLFLYLHPEKLNARAPSEIEAAYPQFAEAFEFIAESLFREKNYRAARTYFRKAVDLIPDYTRPVIGQGNLYFFGLEDYEKALRYYESALEKDPTNTAALYGKGAALHRLGKYPESNSTLDRMLAADILRDRSLTGAGFLYYSGEGNYLKAYNYYLMNNPIRVREYVDTARQFLPDSEEILDLSGVLYLRAQKLEEAQKDFLGAIAKGNSNCNAQMNLGLVYMKMKEAGIEPPPESLGTEGTKGYLENWSLRNEPVEKKALNYFLGSSSCMESVVRYLDRQIDSVPSMDLDSDEKVLLKERLRYKLEDARTSYISNIETMLSEASENVYADSTYLNLMREILARIRDEREK